MTTNYSYTAVVIQYLNIIDGRTDRRMVGLQANLWQYRALLVTFYNDMICVHLTETWQLFLFSIQISFKCSRTKTDQVEVETRKCYSTALLHTYCCLSRPRRPRPSGKQSRENKNCQQKLFIVVKL